jgi:hypothetical protein
MGDAAVEDEDAVKEEDAGNWSPRAAAIAATTTTRPAIRSLRIRRVLVRAGLLQVTAPLEAAWRCPHVCGFRYADDMRQLVASEPSVS